MFNVGKWFAHLDDAFQSFIVKNWIGEYPERRFAVFVDCLERVQVASDLQQSPFIERQRDALGNVDAADQVAEIIPDLGVAGPGVIDDVGVQIAARFVRHHPLVFQQVFLFNGFRNIQQSLIDMVQHVTRKGNIPEQTAGRQGDGQRQGIPGGQAEPD